MENTTKQNAHAIIADKLLTATPFKKMNTFLEKLPTEVQDDFKEKLGHSFLNILCNAISKKGK